ncbi:hypothetical protein ACFFIX_18680 [Metabacillus herbersteinensis]|uniref:Uncharacterized protein n=1 Tax=Metabacillus herbersteinensis TaxID=283816 RepID=A0ABV6GIT4_9BACI
MEKSKKDKKVIPKKVTRFTGDTKLTIENQKALKIMKAIKGSLG